VAAIVWGGPTAAAVSAEVIVVTAFEPFFEWVSDSDPRNWRRTLERHVEGWIEPLRRADVSVRTSIVRDIHPVAAIADTARGRAQLIVVGTHGLGGFTGMRLGGVAGHLVHHAGLPLVLVPAPAHPPITATAAGGQGS
jgi:nucleotide-binding universal stress UspA family protein